MGVRHTLAQDLEKVIGADNLQRLKRAEAKVRRQVIDLLDVEARAKRRKAEARATEAPSAQQRRADLIDALGRRSLDDAVNQEGLKWATNDPFAPHPPTTMSRHDVLAALQRVPDELLLRSIAADPAVLLASDVWPRVPTARNAGRDDELSALWRELGEVPRLG